METVKKIGDGIATGALSGAAVGAFFGPIGAAIGGALGGTAGGIFAGMTDELPPWLQIFSGKEMGGPVSPNTTYTVGEAGPELLRMGSQGGTIIPNNQLPTLAGTLGAMAGPASALAGAGIGNPASAIGAAGTPMDATASQLSSGGTQNALGEAQLARLDMLISETSRANQINTKILQASRS